MTKKRRRIQVCPEGWYYLLVLLFLLAIALLREANLLILLAGLLAGPLLWGWRMAIRSLEGLEVQRLVPSSVVAGDPLAVTLSVTNRRKRFSSWAVIVEDRIVREGDGDEVRSRTFFPHIPPGDTSRQAYRGSMMERGEYRLGPLRVMTRFPFGFYSRQIVVGGTEQMVVLPRLGQLAPAWIARPHPAFEGSRRPRLRSALGSGDFYGVREWRRGESRRWIHWRSSARHGTLVLCQLERHRELDLAVLLDPWLPRRPQVEHQENVELAVSFAATVIAEASRVGSSRLVLGIAAAQPVCVAGTLSTPLVREAMATLAMATASGQDHLAEMLQCVRPRLSRDTDVVLVTTRPMDPDRLGLITGPGGDGWSGPPVRRLRCVDTSDPGLARYFRMEPLES